MGLAGSLGGLRLVPATRRFVGPVEVTARVHVGRRGGVDVDLPPLGDAHLATHSGPLSVHAAPVAVDPDRARGLLVMPAGDADRAAITGRLDELGRRASRDGRALAAAVGVRSVAAALGGAATLAALTWRRPRDVAASTALAGLGLGAAATIAATTRHDDAWREPALSGLLTRAPLLLGDLRAAPARIATYRDQLADLLRTATAVHTRLTQLPDAPPADAIRLVHVSDIHLSPLAHPLARVLVERYDAVAVLDTGDLVDWGTPAEEALADPIAELGVPYVYVKGNHDSPGIAAAVARQPNAVVLGAGDPPREVAGLRFVGMADPRFTPDKTTGDDHSAHRVGEAAEVFAAALKAQASRADIALVHAPAAGRALAGVVPLVLAGDIHRRDVRRYGDTTVLTQGSSGGSGLRGVQQDPPTPVMLSVLFVDRASRRLWGVDEVTLDGLGGTGVRIVRRTAGELIGQASR